jgi:hypothetical protein
MDELLVMPAGKVEVSRIQKEMREKMNGPKNAH